MSIKITTKNTINEKDIKNYVLFANEDFKIKGLNKLSLSKQANAIYKTINNIRLKNKNILSFNITPNQKIILIKMKNSSSSLMNEKPIQKYWHLAGI